MTEGDQLLEQGARIEAGLNMVARRWKGLIVTIVVGVVILVAVGAGAWRVLAQGNAQRRLIVECTTLPPPGKHYPCRDQQQRDIAGIVDADGNGRPDMQELRDDLRAVWAGQPPTPPSTLAPTKTPVTATTTTTEPCDPTEDKCP